MLTASLTLSLSLGAAAPAWGQATVTSARFDVVVAGDGAARVDAAYRIVGLDGAGAVEVALLSSGGVGVPVVTTAAGATVAFAVASGSRRTGSVMPERGADGAATLRLSYEAEGAVLAADGAFRLRVPLVTVSLPPEAEPGVFEAALVLPADWSASDAFPTGFVADADGAWSVALPVVPSMVAMSGRTDGRWRPGAGLIVEIVTALVLLGFCGIGARHLRRRGRGVA